MKNMREILQTFGLQVPEEQTAAFDKAVAENYKTVADYDKQVSKLSAVQEQLKTATDGLKVFEGVDVNDLKAQIANLQGELAEKDTAYQTKLADMEFSSLLDTMIHDAKGKNSKAIRANLDLDALKASKNQSVDMQTALDKLKETDGYLFAAEETKPSIDTGAPHGEADTTDVFLSAAMKAAGVSPDNSKGV